ncbi:Phage integrase family protein [Geopseudomonas sagittaria]|uniref:Phage integrase family protein n=1 Tax=Geopseudomonas sagittaria TaxID=1135990 RepID=A0A1I5SF85_9GAMM|nr:site-specific integrase [Pseudomonas sagittaria]SFP69006.1 Phage integrase family protein [Pseudomonas sagittaria]SFQ53810.1 Phage integrase family protein [Pseudomonas sagittaria]
MRIIHKNEMPEPTLDSPLVQVAWIFDMRASLAKSNSAANNFTNAKKYFLEFIKAYFSEGKALDPYYVDCEFDEYTLLRFKHYFDDLGMSSYHSAGVLSAVRQTFQTAIENQWIKLKSFIDYVLPAGSRETDARRPYSEKDMAAIVKALNDDIRFARKILSPYVRTGRGHAPDLSAHQTLGMKRENGWWDDEDNMCWYFENELNCQAITHLHPDAQKKHKYFLIVATTRHGGIHNLYRRLGVTAWIGHELIMPYIYKLLAETGLNPSVALALKIDDYQDGHPLTNRPYLRYWKERGSGEGELHLELFESGVLTLDDQQAKNIKRIWADVVALTASFRHELPPESRDRLFVYQSRASSCAGQARDFLKWTGLHTSWTKDFVRRHQLFDAQGEYLSVTMSRFRPSLVSRMLKRGVDIYIVKSILGHRSILTTLRYIDSHDFNPLARKEVKNTLEIIRDNRREYECAPKPLAVESYTENDVIFSTGLAFCKNVFSPPESIRKAGGINLGSPCTYFNMCLKCPNVLIVQENLPQLFALRRQYMVAMDQGLSATTHRSAIMQNIHVLNGLLDAKTSDWPDHVLAEAERRSEFIDVLVDPVAIRGMCS